jgi:hypothetical protein
LEIQRLAAAYSHAAMRLDGMAAAATYAEDGVLTAFYKPAIVGRAAIAEALTLTLAPLAFLNQMCAAGVIDVQGDGSTASWTVTELLRRKDEDRLSCCFGSYQDQLVRTSEGWRFASRTLAWPSKSLEEIRDISPDQWGDVHEHFSMLHFIFPNTVIAMYPDTCNLMQVYPGDEISKQRTRMRFYSRVAEPTQAQQDLIMGRFDTFYHVLQNEDYLMVKTAFRNIESGLLPSINFGRNEPALIWLHEALEEAVCGDRPYQIRKVKSASAVA